MRIKSKAGSGTAKVLVACVALVAAIAAIAAPASANVSHAYSHSIGAAGSTPANPYPISSPSDVEVDQGTGDVYVTDPPNHRVEKFDTSGNFVLMFGKAVDQTTGGDLCTAASGDTCQAGAFTSAAGGFETPTYLAVDNYPGGEGSVYVGDTGDNVVQKFTSAGALVSSWGPGGQKDGSDASDLPVFGPLFGIAVGGRCASPAETNTGDCEPVGTLYVGGTHYSYNVWEYTQSGEYIKWTGTQGIPWLKVDPYGNFYYADSPFGTFGNQPRVFKSIPDKGAYQDATGYEMATDWPTTGFAFDPATEELYQGTGVRMQEGTEVHGPRIDHYSTDCDPPASNPCEPADSFGEGQLSGAKGMAVDGGTHAVYVANSGSNDVAVFNDVRPIVTTGEPSGVTDSSVTLTGHIDPAGRGDITECHFEYGFDKKYGTVLPCTPDPASSPPGSHFTGPTDVSATITGLSPGTKDHYRLVATNEAEATSAGADRTFVTTSPPAVTGLTAEHLTATSADLEAVINPNGLETHYRFQYGTTTSYGQVSPVPDGSLTASNEGQKVVVHLEELATHFVYHYRLIAENADGTTTTEDHTFNFYPPSCPNENVRQQTQANFLPDCRAYELVSPGDAGGTQLFANGPNTGYATSPPRFAYTGLFSTIPGSGGSPIDGSGDLYVATRTGTGWVSRYVGWSSKDAAVDGGPPMGPPGSTPGPIRDASQMAANGGHLTGSQDGVLTDLGMSRFLSFNDGNQSISSIFGADFQNRTPIGSNAPLVFGADGTRLDRWPTNLGSVPDGSYPPETNIYPHGGYPYEGEEPATVAPGGMKAMNCPTAYRQGSLAANDCPGDVTASADLRHFVFATEWNVFAPGGQLSAPGSVYDNQTDEDTVTVASKNVAGEDIPSEPTDHAGDPLQIPAVSKDGSHILMAAGATGPCGFSTCPHPPCGDDYSATKRCQMQLSHLYMRVDEAVTYDVSKGHAVDYVGSDGAGTKVYFLSEEELTPEDHDTSADLYQWSQSTDSLTLVSKGDNAGNPGEPGNSDACPGGLETFHAGLTSKCGVATYTQWFFCKAESEFKLSGGNCISDNSIASENGDIYFFSPELLDGSRGIPNQANLYDYREGNVQYVTTLTGDPTCFESYSLNTCSRITRMQVTPGDTYMAFVTASPVTQYDNAGRQEMYRYNPDTREIICVSCIPSGARPSTNVEASQDGLFMANDGRVFFSTEDPLVHADTNKAQDVYEYVDGRPQLITLGTGDTRTPKAGLFSVTGPGLVSVSADGRDAYFSTYDTLVRQDHNGLFLKFYDARSGGGFSAPAPPPACEAADECHGPASEPGTPFQEGTAESLTGGQVPSRVHKRDARRHKRHRRSRGSRRHSRHAHAHRAGRAGK